MTGRRCRLPRRSRRFGGRAPPRWCAIVRRTGVRRTGGRRTGGRRTLTAARLWRATRLALRRRVRPWIREADLRGARYRLPGRPTVGVTCRAAPRLLTWGLRPGAVGTGVAWRIMRRATR
ncbi:MAG: hypothetical protein ACRDRC_10120, partial [Pseudonocardiaceae bacterium]